MCFLVSYLSERYDIPIRIAYCTNVRLPSERAHGHQIAQVCDALVHLGHGVTLFAPCRRNLIEQNYHAYYGAERGIKLRYLDAFDNNRYPVPLGLPGLYLANASLRRALRRALDAERFDLLYTRSPGLLPALLHRGTPVILELHQLPRLGRRSFVRNCNACTRVSCLTSPMQNALTRMGVDPRKIIVEGDAVDLEIFAEARKSNAWRRTHSIPLDMPLIGYAGQLKSMGLSKGVEVLMNALRELHAQEQEFRAVIAGGPQEEILRLTANINPALQSSIHFLGTIPHREVPALMTASDVLVYPAPASNHPYYMRDTSPLKLFEYMASGTPIVCADLPPIRDIASEQEVAFVPPGDPSRMAQAIMRVIREPAEAAQRAARARELVQKHTWEKRMQRILAHSSLH